jgi:hypothetical protein
MRSRRQGSIPSDLGWLVDELDDIAERLRTLEAPSGEALGSTVAKLSALVANIQAQLDAWTATRYTNTQIDTKDNAVAAQIYPAINATLAGNVTVGGVFYNPPAYNFDITYTRRTAWLGNDGRLGYASSSAKKKTSIEPADEDRLARLLDIVPKSFIYREEVRRRTRLRINDGIDYVPPRELGLIAEELDAAGLHEFVIYGEDDEPEGIEYGMLVVALLAIDRSQRRELDEIRERLDRMESDR